MRRDRTIAAVLLSLQIVLWLGFLIHSSPRFPGSLAGGLLALFGSLLLTLPVVLYSAMKRVGRLRRWMGTLTSMSTLLDLHVYSSLVGAILAILHTGHRFESPLGIFLTATMLAAVLTGFIGRYYFNFAAQEVREKQAVLDRLTVEYNNVVKTLAAPDTRPARRSRLRATINSVVGTELLTASDGLPARAMKLAESIADVEYAIKTHVSLKSRASSWLYAHLAAYLAFYLLLAIHVGSEIYLGLRWFDRV